MVSSLPPPPTVVATPSGATWWQTVLMALSIVLIILLAAAAFGLSIVTVCGSGSAAACDDLKRLINIDFFGQVALAVVAVVILLLPKLSWGRRTALVMLVGALAIAIDSVLRHLISVSPAHF